MKMSDNLTKYVPASPVVMLSDDKDSKSLSKLNEGLKMGDFDSEELAKLRNAITDLNGKCETLEKQNRELSEELANTKRTLQAESEALANKTDDSKELETLKWHTKQVEEDFAALVLERDSLEINLEELDNQHQQAIDKLIQSRDALSVQLKDLIAENENLKTKNSNTVLKEQVSELQLMIGTLEAQVTEKEHQVQSLKNILKVYKENLDPELEVAKTKEAELQRKLDEQIKNNELDRARLMAVLNDKTRENSNLKAEVHRLVNIISAERAALTKVQKDCELLVSANSANNEDLTKQTVQNLSRLVADKDLEITALKEKNLTLTALIQDESSEGIAGTVFSDIEGLKQKISAYETEKEQIIAVVNQKHQESVSYHSELLKTMAALQEEKRKFELLKQQNEELLRKLNEKQMAYLSSQNEAVALQGKLAQLEQQQEQLQQRYHRLLEEDNPVKTETTADQDVEVNSDVSSTVRIDRDDWTSKLQELQKFQQVIHDKDKLLYEKDCLVHEKMRQIESSKELFKRKEEEVSTINQRLGHLSSQLESSRAETVGVREQNANLRSKLENFRSEIALLKETNSTLSVTLQEREFELKALRGKVETLSRLVEQQRSMSSTNREEEERNNIKKLLKDSEEMRQRAQGFQAERDQTLLALNHKHAEIEHMQEQMRAMKEKEERLIREVERLRNHLIHVEEGYTQEALSAEEREKDLRTRLALAEDRIQMATSNHSMASQHASLQVESLQEQLRSVMEQRDVALNKSSNLEDLLAQKSAALRTLQVVLEQLQEEKRRDIATYQSQCESALRLQKGECLRLGAELECVNAQLQEANEALSAASRLTEQLDRKEETIQMLKEHVEYQEVALEKAKAQIELMRSRSDVTVDKTIMKNLMVGYITVHGSQQKDVLRVVATVLDFSKDERERTGLDETKSGWISWLSGKPPVSPTKSRQTAQTKQSLTEAFVRFLESESQPKPKIKLPIESFTTSSRDSRLKNDGTTSSHQQNPFVASLMPSHSDNQSNMLMKSMTTALPTFVPLTDRDSTSEILRDVLK